MWGSGLFLFVCEERIVVGQDELGGQPPQPPGLEKLSTQVRNERNCRKSLA